jgi:hypothetical protein
MNRCDGLGRSPIREKLAVFRMLSNIDRQRCQQYDNIVSINLDDNSVYDKVSVFREKVHDRHIAGMRLGHVVDASLDRSPLASVTIAMSGMPTSLGNVRMVVTNPACIM